MSHIYMTPGSRNEPLCHTYVTRDSEYVNVKFFNIKLFLY